MKVQFQIVVKNGLKTVAEVTGREEGVDAGTITVADLTENVIRTEQFLERLTGLRWHINQVK